MEFSQALRRRKMTRSFEDRPVPTELLDAILAGALRAPSAGFAQGVDLLTLSAPEARLRFWRAASEPEWRERSTQAPGLLAAPVIVVPVADPSAYLRRYAAADKSGSDLAGRPARDWDVPYWLIDAAFAVMTILLAAADAGLGALFFRLHRPEDSVLASFGVPHGRRTVGAVALGFASGPERPTSPGRVGRRSMDEVVHRDRW